MLHSHVDGAVTGFVCKTKIIGTNVSTVTQLKEAKQPKPLMETVVVDVPAVCVFDDVTRLPIASSQQAIPECRDVVELLDHCNHVADRP